MATSSNVKTAMQGIKEHKESRKQDTTKGLKYISVEDPKEMKMHELPDKKN